MDVLFEEFVNFRVRIDIEFCLQKGEFVFWRNDVVSSICGFDAAQPRVDIFLVEAGKFRFSQRPDLTRLVAEGGADGRFRGDPLLSVALFPILSQSEFNCLRRDPFHGFLVDHFGGCEIEG